MRLHQMDPDFRRQPKTNTYCWCCQRDLHPPYLVVFVSKDHPDSIVHTEDVLPNAANADMQFIGRGCSKGIPRGFVADYSGQDP